MRTKSNGVYQIILPNIFGFKGGEQVYGAFLLDFLAKLSPKATLTVFLKREKSLAKRKMLSTVKTHYFGHLPRHLQILLLSLKFIWVGFLTKTTLTITGHINYAPICFILNRLMGTPYWVVAHGLEVWNLRGPLRKIALRNADRILAVSTYTRERLLKEQKLDPNRVVVLPATFDAQRFKIAPKPKHLLTKYKLHPNQPIILTVTRLTPYKGYNQILEALPEIRHSIPDVHYLLVGKGKDVSHIQALVEKLNLQDSVTLVGFVPDNELCDYYNLCDLFAMPSSGEGFGIVFLEALACGKPILGGYCDGSTEPLQQGQLGCLVDPDDIHQIADSIVKILSGMYQHPLMYNPEALRQQAIDRFGFTKFRQALDALVLEFR